MTTPSHTVKDPLEVHEKIYQKFISIEKFDGKLVKDEAGKYTRTGNGPIKVKVAYDPKTPVLDARQSLGRIEKQFRAEGIPVEGSILPVKDINKPIILVLYDAIEVRPPSECDGSRNQLDVEDPSEEYLMGCTHREVFSRQIYRQTDLLHDEDQGTQDGLADRYSNTVDTYRSGKRSPEFRDITSTADE